MYNGDTGRLLQHPPSGGRVEVRRLVKARIDDGTRWLKQQEQNVGAGAEVRTNRQRYTADQPAIRISSLHGIRPFTRDVHYICPPPCLITNGPSSSVPPIRCRLFYLRPPPLSEVCHVSADFAGNERSVAAPGSTTCSQSSRNRLLIPGSPFHCSSSASHSRRKPDTLLHHKLSCVSSNPPQR